MDIDQIKSKDKSPKYYQYYPRLFNRYFNSVDDKIIGTLSDAGYLYYQSILYTDSLIDKGDFSMFSSIQIYQEESIKMLSSIYSMDSIFWKYWNKRRNEYFEAVKIEKSLHEYNQVSLGVYEDLCDKKSAFGKVAIDCLYTIENEINTKSYEQLLKSHYYFSVGFQLYDDIKDFKEDFLRKQFNWAIYELSKSIKFEDYKHDVSILNKLLYVRGIGQNILQKSIEYFHKSISILEELNLDSEWLAVNIEMKKTIENYLDVTIGYLKTIEKKIEVKNNKLAENHFFDYNDVNEGAIKNGLQFIEADYLKNFAELKHYMYLSSLDGFDNASQVHFSDTFQRALLNDCLITVAGKFNINAQHYFTKECDYLIGRTNKDNGGWSYFPSVKEVAADIDDLGQVIQLFIESRNIDLIEQYCLTPIQIALRDRVTDDGGIETWIIPLENQNDIQKKQEFFNGTKWGKGPDVEVVANFIFALHKLNKPEFTSFIMNGINYVLANQSEGGFWVSRWYYGNYYGTYVCLRLLKEFNENDIPINNALNFITATQNEDGGFSISAKNASDPLNTALALLTLKLFLPHDLESIKKAEAYLIKSQSTSGFWKEVDFIKPKADEPYRSKTMTTAFVLKSLC